MLLRVSSLILPNSAAHSDALMMRNRRLTTAPKTYIQTGLSLVRIALIVFTIRSMSDTSTNSHTNIPPNTLSMIWRLSREMIQSYCVGFCNNM